MRLGLGTRSRRGRVSSGLAPVAGYGPEAAAFFAALAIQPPAAKKDAVDAFVATLKTAGVWARMDWISIPLAGLQSFRVNLVNPAQVATVTGTVAWTDFAGMTGDGTTGYLDTGFNPITASTPKFLQNDAHMGAQIGTNVSSLACDMGQNRAGLYTRNSTALLTYPNAGTSVSATLPVATSIGHSLWTRRSATATELYRDGASIGTSATASAAPFSHTFVLGAGRTSAGAAASFSNRQIRAAHFGGQLSAGEVSALNGALSTLLAALAA